ncbi:GFA family protein [Pseudoalteromonas tunicata]|jgi:hypothetical protein|uniref:CENP-V/GFA domain-containing protein n=1 Tax=Pseudoalteromonas tunicata D2 TaxID=87626 RepID=A4C4M7_9GAMM|nr:GFA family protein [Pseudoalteromonas tunicata]ATC97012.1 hypothetical protein PTUN_b0665 [Pseudoalteromonas tunicata]AXT33132.1 GFA family protein [Pseudoalteromonas tunicata]EAR30509.1 hypothetical protein PTD2_03031 [Pseudoalteromonas tunicata D2]MDP4984882.1 GFA family protein [Pseudoalteromonas tunicata]
MLLNQFKGGCHCGAIRFVVSAAVDAQIEDCNCSICTKSGFLHLIVPNAQFELQTDKELLSTYTFNTGVAQHYFCKTCGIKPFYIPRSNPDGIDVNVRCLDEYPVSTMQVVPFDGQNWEQHAHTLSHKTKKP